MCKDCGCSVKAEQNSNWHQHEDGTWHTHDHDHDHDHDHHHETHHPSHEDKKVVIDTTLAVLAKNDEIAQNNRVWFLKNKILCLNFISSPGSGKTLLLEKLLRRLSEKFKVAVLVGDQATSLDADRLQDKGASVKQINTHSSCHLDAPHIQKELGSFISPEIDVLIIENVGNLVCPSAFDLGEAAKVALLSTTEGEDKPVKYPVLFSQAQAIILTKMDLVPHLQWSLQKAKSQVRRLNAMAPLFETSAVNEEGLESLVRWIEQRLEVIRSI